MVRVTRKKNPIISKYLIQIGFGPSVKSDFIFIAFAHPETSPVDPLACPAKDALAQG